MRVVFLERELMEGLIFDIQGFSVHDGSGCRTLVFLSGCPLRCRWCSNPEGQIMRPRLMYRQMKCTHTHYRCIQACPQKSVRRVDANTPLQFDRSLCDACDSMDCVQVCLSEALQISGKTYSVGQLLRILERDHGFWGNQGGVTFGGGEPLCQAEFLIEILSKCRSRYMHTTVETSAHADSSLFLEVLHRTDEVLVDLKHMDSTQHRYGTGAGNELILENITKLATHGWGGRTLIRIPIVPGFNDSIENLTATSRFVAGLKLQEVNLLPIHHLGRSKYEQLGVEYEYSHLPMVSKEELISYQKLFESAGLKCYLGSEVPF